MSFKQLLTAISAGETENATELAKSIEKDFNANVEEIDKLETKASEAISTRDKMKSKLRALAERAGVDELTADAIDDIKSKRGGNVELEAKHQAELDKSAKRIEEIEADNKLDLAKSESRYKDAVIDTELLKIGASANAVNESALEDIVRHLKENAAIEDGDVVYKIGEGVNERNDKGRPLTLQDKLEGLKLTRSYLFRGQVQNGSGEHHQSGGGSNSKKFADYSSGELVELRRSDPTAYDALKKAS